MQSEQLRTLPQVQCHGLSDCDYNRCCLGRIYFSGHWCPSLTIILADWMLKVAEGYLLCLICLWHWLRQTAGSALERSRHDSPWMHPLASGCLWLVAWPLSACCMRLSRACCPAQTRACTYYNLVYRASVAHGPKSCSLLNNRYAAARGHSRSPRTRRLGGAATMPAEAE